MRAKYISSMASPSEVGGKGSGCSESRVDSVANDVTLRS